MPNILLSYRAYPVSVGVMFRHAFRRLGCKVLTVGPYHEIIPWARHMDFTRYLDIPDFIMPNEPMGDAEYALGSDIVQAFNPDLLVQIDAGYYLRMPPDGRGFSPSLPIPNVHVASDPHAINYHKQFYSAHFCVSMQHCYIQPLNDALKIVVQWVPYAFDPQVHYWNPHRVRKHDVTLISGLMYPERLAALEAFKEAGLAVRHEVGLLYEEGTEVYNQGMIAFNWSSKQDLPMRFWEGFAYRNVVLTNRVPDLLLFPEFHENTHYLAYDSLDECVEKAKWCKDNPEKAEVMAGLGYARAWIGRHTYAQRAKRILGIAGIEL